MEASVRASQGVQLSPLTVPSAHPPGGSRHRHRELTSGVGKDNLASLHGASCKLRIVEYSTLFYGLSLLQTSSGGAGREFRTAVPVGWAGTSRKPKGWAEGDLGPLEETFHISCGRAGAFKLGKHPEGTLSAPHTRILP